MSEPNPYAAPQANVGDTEQSHTGELASRGARLGSAILDGCLSALVMFPAVYLFGFWDRLSAIEQSPVDQLQLQACGLLVYVALNGYLLMKHGQTIGKRLVGIRIVSYDDNTLLPFWRVFWLRAAPVSLVIVIPYVGNLLVLIDILFIFRNDRRCLHDLLAGSKVVKA